MGVTCALSSANATQVALLTADPRLVESFLAEDHEPAPATWLQRLLHPRPRVPAAILDTGDSMRTDLDKAWHGIHFLLTGSADEAPLPAGLIMSGGQQLAGASHLLDPAQVAECHRYLGGISDDQLAEAFDPVRMDELGIYPTYWRRDGVEGLDYLLVHAQTLRAVLRDCVDEGHGLVITIE